jgi:hypothetical protein
MITMIKQFCSREETLVLAGDLGVETQFAKYVDGWRPLVVTPMPTTFGIERKHRGLCRDNLWMPSRGMESAGFTGECGVLSFQRYLFAHSEAGRAEAMAAVSDSKPVWAAFYMNAVDVVPGDDRADDIARYAAKKKLPPIRRLRRRASSDDQDDSSSSSSSSSGSSGSSGSSDDDEDTYNQSMSMSVSASSGASSMSSSRHGALTPPHALAMVYNRNEIDRAADDLLAQHRHQTGRGHSGGSKERCTVM